MERSLGHARSDVTDGLEIDAGSLAFCRRK